MRCLMLLLLQLLLLVAAASAVADDESGTKINYMIIASNTAKIGANYTIGISLIGSAGISSVQAKLFTEDANEGYSNVSLQASRAQEGRDVTSMTLQLSLADIDSSEFDPQANYKLNVTITTTDATVFTNQTDITVMKPHYSTLVQTDKGIYQPGQTVQYRVVNVDDSLKPVMSNTRVLIRDAKYNLIYSMWHNSSSSSNTASSPQAAAAAAANEAVSEGSLPLSELPVEGRWSLEASSDLGGSQTKYFEVRRYVLPKFTLDLSVPDFVHVNDTQFKVTATVRYTFNKAVEGKLKVKLGPYQNCRGCKPRYDLVKDFSVDVTDKADNEFSFDLQEWRQQMLDEKVQLTSRSTYNVKAEVEFTEKFTGIKKTVAKSFKIFTRRYSVKASAPSVQFFLPGTTVPFVATLQRPDGKPFTQTTTDKLSVTLLYYRRGKQQSKSVFDGDMQAAETGTGVSLRIVVPADADFRAIGIVAEVTGSDSSKDNVRIVPYLAFTDDLLMLDLSSDGVELTSQLNRTAGIETTFIATLSRKELQYWDIIKNEPMNLFKTWNTSMEMCNQMLPEITVAAFGVTKNGEILASADKQDLSMFLRNVTLTSDLTNNTGEPQQEAKIKVQAEANSFVFLSGIDHSVNLLKQSNDILRKDVMQQATTATFRSYPWRPQPKAVTTEKVLRDNGLLLMTDGFYYTEPQEIASPPIMYEMASSSPRSRGRSGGLLAKSDSNRDAAGGGGGGEEEDEQVRDFFPETMLWSVVRTDASGAAEQSVTLPDTITSWDIVAFGLKSSAPIQTMNSALQLVTQKKFFIRPVLPVSIVRGEKFILKVMTFNYIAKNMAVNVSLMLNDSFEATALSGQNSWTTEKLLGVELPASATASISMAAFEIVPKRIGEILIDACGFFTIGGESERVTTRDIVIRPLRVIPEGVVVMKTDSAVVTIDDGDMSKDITIEFPAVEDIVKDSEVLSFNLIGDVLGSAMENVGKLIRMPSGCGEQNLAKFAPAVSVARYFKTAKTGSSESMEKALRAMQTGYQRQLIYKRRDGSYSAFGDKDNVGSVWLTAFTLATYAGASDFVTIDADAIAGRSLQFVLDAQAKNGAFSELAGGKVFDSSLQGEVGTDSVSMTAFVCLSLIEVKQTVSAKYSLQTTMWKSADVDGAITKCLWFLKEASAKSQELNALEAALSTYTMATASEALSDDIWKADMQQGLNAVRNRLEELEIEVGDKKYWQMATKYGWKRDSVEATAYAMMDNTMQEASPEFEILRWLSSKQNSLGGFDTTQSTVVAIKALTMFAEKYNINSGSNISANISIAFGEDDLEKNWNFTMNADNKWILRSAIVARGSDARDTELEVTANGTATALVTAVWRYNVIGQVKQQLSSDWLSESGMYLRLGAKIPQPIGGGAALNVCATASANLTSGMYILTVTNPTGHSVSEHTQPEGVAGLKRVEPESESIVFYFDALKEPICVFTKWSRDVPVIDAAPLTLTLQKYYQPEQQVTALYSLPELKGLNACQACAECPGCDGIAGLLRRVL